MKELPLLIIATIAVVLLFQHGVALRRVTKCKLHEVYIAALIDVMQEPLRPGERHEAMIMRLLERADKKMKR